MQELSDSAVDLPNSSADSGTDCVKIGAWVWAFSSCLVDHLSPVSPMITDFLISFYSQTIELVPAPAETRTYPTHVPAMYSALYKSG